MTNLARGLASGLAMAVLAILMPGALARAQSDGGVPAGTVLDFHVMAPVTKPFTGNANPIRGVNGGGLPWTIRHGDGTVRADGQLEINVAGLVLANDPSVPQNQRGTNTSPSFMAIVSCMTVDPTGATKPVNVSTPPSNATATGDARIDATLALPTPCLAPMVFVTDATGAWLAVSGVGAVSAGAFVVIIQNLNYTPLNLSVPPGATITVRNLDGILHSLTSEAAMGNFSPGAVNGVSFDTGLFMSGDKTITISANAPPGTVVPFFCMFHLSTMPQGTITVQPGATPPQ